MARDILTPPVLTILLKILLTRYLNGRHRVPKQGNLHIAWNYTKNPKDISNHVT